MNPDLQVEVKPSIRARKIQEEKMRKQMQKEEYWRRREEEERWRMEMRYGYGHFLSIVVKEERQYKLMMYPYHLWLEIEILSKKQVCFGGENAMAIKPKL